MSGWAAILGAARVEHEHFERACNDPSAAQIALLKRILADNADTEFGRAHGFARIDSTERFRAQLPIQDYDALRPWIERAAAGESGLLTTEPVIAFEETGGSTSGRKLVPYTQTSLAAFRAAVLPWLFDLADERPKTFDGRAYVALSPVARAPRVTVGGIPIGLPSEGAYLGADLAQAFAAVLAVPVEVAEVCDVDDWRLLTLRHLLAASDLTFISVWSPTFLINLVEALPALTEPLLKSIRDGAVDPQRMHVISIALARRPIDTRSIWPRLATVSAGPTAARAPMPGACRSCFPKRNYSRRDCWRPKARSPSRGKDRASASRRCRARSWSSSTTPAARTSATSCATARAIAWS